MISLTWPLEDRCLGYETIKSVTILILLDECRFDQHLLHVGKAVSSTNASNAPRSLHLSSQKNNSLAMLIPEIPAQQMRN